MAATPRHTDGSGGDAAVQVRDVLAAVAVAEAVEKAEAEAEVAAVQAAMAAFVVVVTAAAAVAVAVAAVVVIEMHRRKNCSQCRARNCERGGHDINGSSRKETRTNCLA
jgi:hypothetical protein